MNHCRLKRVREILVSRKLEGFIVTNRLNVRWLSGFTGSNGAVLVTDSQLFLFTDSRYDLQAASQAPDAEISISNDPVSLQAARKAGQLGLKSVGFEADDLTVSAHKAMKAELPSTSLRATQSLIARLRYVKSPEEIDRIRKAVQITDLTFRSILGSIRPGVSEKDLAAELAYILKKNGAESESFPSIVASAERSALPHAVPTDALLAAGSQVLMDFGGQYEGYAGDMTRTVFLGRATDKFRDIYSIVLDAQLEAIAAVGPGKPGRQIDAVARDYIASHGYESAFGHSLGHSIGLDVHDGAALSPRSDLVLESGMVVTVEPGIYLEGWGGVRIEDNILVTETGYENLTASTKELLEL